MKARLILITKRSLPFKEIPKGLPDPHGYAVKRVQPMLKKWPDINH